MIFTGSANDFAFLIIILRSSREIRNGNDFMWSGSNVNGDLNRVRCSPFSYWVVVFQTFCYSTRILFTKCPFHGPQRKSVRAHKEHNLRILLLCNVFYSHASPFRELNSYDCMNLCIVTIKFRREDLQIFNWKRDSKALVRGISGVFSFKWHILDKCDGNWLF